MNTTHAALTNTVEHPGCTSAALGATGDITSSHMDGVIRGKCHHKETLGHTGLHLGLKGLTFHVGKHLALPTSAGDKKELHPITCFLPENSFSTKDALGRGLGQPLTQNAGLVISWQEAVPGLTPIFFSSTTLAQNHSHLQKAWQLPKYRIISF